MPVVASQELCLRMVYAVSEDEVQTTNLYVCVCHSV